MGEKAIILCVFDLHLISGDFFLNGDFQIKKQVNVIIMLCFNKIYNKNVMNFTAVSSNSSSLSL